MQILPSQQKLTIEDFSICPFVQYWNFKHWKKYIKTASQASQPTSHSHRRYPVIFGKKSKLLALRAGEKIKCNLRSLKN